MSCDPVRSAADLFGVLTETARLLRQAHDNGRAWESDVRATEGPDGQPDGGYEVRIVIGPKGAG